MKTGVIKRERSKGYVEEWIEDGKVIDTKAHDPRPSIDTEVKVCDFCGEDATSVVTCARCEKDCCRPHLLHIKVGTAEFDYNPDTAKINTYYCFPCGPEIIKETYKLESI